jgi:hypothetical protein
MDISCLDIDLLSLYMRLHGSRTTGTFWRHYGADARYAPYRYLRNMDGLVSRLHGCSQPFPEIVVDVLTNRWRTGTTSRNLYDNAEAIKQAFLTGEVHPSNPRGMDTQLYERIGALVTAAQYTIKVGNLLDVLALPLRTYDGEEEGTTVGDVVFSLLVRFKVYDYASYRRQLGGVPCPFLENVYGYISVANCLGDLLPLWTTAQEAVHGAILHPLYPEHPV